MSWWKFVLDTTLSADESWFVDRYPAHMARAFLAFDYDESDPLSEGWQWRPYHLLVEEAIRSFVTRWGGLDDATFVRVLHEGRGRDRLVAIFALGHNPAVHAADLLVPFLESTDQLERCAAAVMLGLRRDVRTFPVLVEYLLHEPPRDEQGPYLFVPEASIWYESYRRRIAALLATWGPEWFVPVLRQAFLRLWQWEQEHGGNVYLYDTHDALLYALGRRGALAAVHGIELLVPRRRLAMLYLAAGSLRLAERFSDPTREMSFNQAVQQEIAVVLERHFALAEEEARTCVAAFYNDTDMRRSALYEFPTEENEEKDGLEENEE